PPRPAVPGPAAPPETETARNSRPLPPPATAPGTTRRDVLLAVSVRKGKSRCIAAFLCVLLRNLCASACNLRRVARRGAEAETQRSQRDRSEREFLQSRTIPFCRVVGAGGAPLPSWKGTCPRPSSHTPHCPA